MNDVGLRGACTVSGFTLSRINSARPFYGEVKGKSCNHDGQRRTQLEQVEISGPSNCFAEVEDSEHGYHDANKMILEIVETFRDFVC